MFIATTGIFVPVLLGMLYLRISPSFRKAFDQRRTFYLWSLVVFCCVFTVLCAICVIGNFVIIQEKAPSVPITYSKILESQCGLPVSMSLKNSLCSYILGWRRWTSVLA